MDKEILEINILPAKYIEKFEDKHAIRILIGNEIIEDRIFDNYACDGMINPKYLFIGIMTGVGFHSIKIIQADEYEEMFMDKWKILTE